MLTCTLCQKRLAGSRPNHTRSGQEGSVRTTMFSSKVANMASSRPSFQPSIIRRPSANADTTKR